jgi:hypothetical protein
MIIKKNRRCLLERIKKITAHNDGMRTWIEFVIRGLPNVQEANDAIIPETQRNFTKPYYANANANAKPYYDEYQSNGHESNH